MSVYVDGMRAKFGRMVMCHMFADSHDELVTMADRIGVALKWIQQEGTLEHFDIALSKRARAIEAGAVVEFRLREILRERRAREAASAPEGT